MVKVTVSQEDGSSEDFFPQSYTDEAVAAAVAAAQSAPSVPVVSPGDVEVDIVLSDGSTKTFVPKV